MIRPVTFTADVRFMKWNEYYICYRTAMHMQVMISCRLKEIIEQRTWSCIQREDLDEIRSLRELGFVVEEPFSRNHLE